MLPSKRLLLKSKKVSLDRLATVDGINPLRLLMLRLKRVRLVNEPKSNWASVPLRLAWERLISETVPVVPHTTPVQLQRFSMLVRAHDELREGEEDKLFFHWMRASASVLDEDVTLKESKEMRKTN